jgi:hypothetical protein
MNLRQVFMRSVFSLAVMAVFAISTADAQQRRQDGNSNRTNVQRRPDSNWNRTNVQCELNFWDARSKADIEDALDEAYQYCRSGDTLVLGSSSLVARLCDFGWTIASMGQDVVVCVYGGRRELR